VLSRYRGDRGIFAEQQNAHAATAGAKLKKPEGRSAADRATMTQPAIDIASSLNHHRQ